MEADIEDIIRREYPWQSWDVLTEKTGLSAEQLKRKATKMGIRRFPHILKRAIGNRDEPWKGRGSIHLHPYVERALHLIDYMPLLLNHHILHINHLTENGISTGEAVYTIQALHRLGAIRSMGNHKWRINHRRVAELLDNNVWKGM